MWVDKGIDVQAMLQAGPSPHTRPPDTVLSRREIDVLRLVARGLSNTEISAHLTIEARTSETHIGKILHKLQLENRTQLALYALRHGLVSLYDE